MRADALVDLEGLVQVRGALGGVAGGEAVLDDSFEAEGLLGCSVRGSWPEPAVNSSCPIEADPDKLLL